MPVDRQRKGKKLPEDSDEGSSGTRSHRLERYKPSKRREERDSPPHHVRPKEREYTLERHRSDRHKGPFTRRIAEYSIPHAFMKPPKLETFDCTANPDEHVEHFDTVLDYHRAKGMVK